MVTPASAHAAQRSCGVGCAAEAASGPHDGRRKRCRGAERYRGTLRSEARCLRLSAAEVPAMPLFVRWKTRALTHRPTGRRGQGPVGEARLTGYGSLGVTGSVVPLTMTVRSPRGFASVTWRLSLQSS